MNIKFGDIVTYRDREDYIITHRITNIEKSTFIAKGDANNLQDETQPISNIKGKVLYHSKLLGFFVLHILKPLVAIYVILFVIINVYIYKKENEENENLEIKKDEIKKTTDCKNIT